MDPSSMRRDILRKPWLARYNRRKGTMSHVHPTDDNHPRQRIPRPYLCHKGRHGLVVTKGTIKKTLDSTILRSSTGYRFGKRRGIGGCVASVRVDDATTTHGLVLSPQRHCFFEEEKEMRKASNAGVGEEEGWPHYFLFGMGCRTFRGFP